MNDGVDEVGGADVDLCHGDLPLLLTRSAEYGKHGVPNTCNRKPVWFGPADQELEDGCSVIFYLHHPQTYGRQTVLVREVAEFRSRVKIYVAVLSSRSLIL